MTDPALLYALVLLAALSHAVWNLAVKAAADRVMMLAGIRAVGLPLGIGMAAWGGWAMPAAAFPWLLAAVAAHFAYYALLVRSYALGDMGQVYPIARGTPPLILAGGGVLLAGEVLSPAQAGGVALCSLGILLLSSGRGAGRQATVTALATAACIAAYSWCGAMGVRAAGNVAVFQGWLEILSGIGVIAWVGLRRPADTARFARDRWALAAGAGTLSVLGYLAFLAAVAVLPMAPVAAVRESSVLFGTILSTLVLKEAFAPRRLLAAALVFTGIVLIAMG